MRNMKNKLTATQKHSEIKRHSDKKSKRQAGNEKMDVKLKSAFDEIVNILSMTIEMRDPFTVGHSCRVTKLACAIAESMGLQDEQINGLRTAGLLHDIGKITIPNKILSKTSKLSKVEFDIVENHSQAGYVILKNIDFPWPVARIVLEHHERIDGSGYPNRKKGDELLIESKILAVADTIEAMSLNRPHRKALQGKEAIEEITSKQGTLYDAKVVEACIKLFKKGKLKFLF